MMNFKVDSELCVACGECSGVCPRMIIRMDGELPVADPDREGNCIGCQQCFTVCPTGAISLFGLDPEASTPLKNNFPEPEAMATLIKGRRSCRKYKPEAVDPAILDELLDITAHAPTGVNTMQTLFTVVDDPAVMDDIRNQSYSELKRLAEAGQLPEEKQYFESFLAPWYDKGADTLYRGAPHMLVTSSPASGPCAEADGYIALSYFELMANVMGLGTVWCGLGKWLVRDLVPALRKRLNIPEDHVFVYMMMFGYPDRTYHRTAQRGNARVNRVR